jgi:hypothetical protein
MEKSEIRNPKSEKGESRMMPVRMGKPEYPKKGAPVAPHFLRISDFGFRISP